MVRRKGAELRINLNLSEKQAEKVVSNICSNGFIIHGLGHFDISYREKVKLIQLAFENNGSKKCEEYYSILESKYMG